jgi:hypothetical protein
MRMSVIDTSHLSPRQVYQSLQDRLSDFRKRVRGQLLLEGIARLLAAAVVLAFVTFILDRRHHAVRGDLAGNYYANAIEA